VLIGQQSFRQKRQSMSVDLDRSVLTAVLKALPLATRNRPVTATAKRESERIFLLSSSRLKSILALGSIDYSYKEEDGAARL
jgi:hypothetical protein